MTLKPQEFHSSKDRVPSKVANAELVAERREHLVKSATSLFLQKGFHKASVREIASAAGWQMGTLYLYISKKEDVLYLISQTIMDRLWDGLHKLPHHDDPLVALRESMVYYFDAVDELRNEIRLLYRESASLMPEQLQALKESELGRAHLLRDNCPAGNHAAPLPPDGLGSFRAQHHRAGALLAAEEMGACRTL